MKTTEKLKELKLKLYYEIQKDIKKYGFTELVKIGINPRTLSKIMNQSKKNEYVSAEKLIDIKNKIDNFTRVK